jgi:citrate synthase
MFISTVGALSTFYPTPRHLRPRRRAGKQIVRLIAKVPTIAAFAYRHASACRYVYPDNDL